MFNRRLLVFLGFVAAAMVVAMLRLGNLQLVRGADFADKAEQQQIRRRTLHTHRGDIVDRNGEILATDKACFDFSLEYSALLLDWSRRRRGELMRREGLDAYQAGVRVDSALSDAEELALLNRWIRRYGRRERISVDQARLQLTDRIDWTLNRAAELTGRPREHIDRSVDETIARVQQIRRIVGTEIVEESSSHTVIDALDEAAAVQLRDESADMVAATVGPSTFRFYPYDDLACHVIGRLGRVTAEVVRNDPNADDPLLRYLQFERTGVSGVERICEPTLRGSRGRQDVHKSGRELMRTAPAGGREVALTLDIKLQEALTRMLVGQPFNGAAVVLHVPTGEILALVSTPTYNLNTYAAQHAQLVTDDANFPLMNRAVTRNYPPGSTVKIVTALAGLAENIITPQSEYLCLGAGASRRPRCWSPVGHSSIQLSDAIMNSCNSYFARTADHLGIDRLSFWFRQFGFGSLSGVGLPGESAGLVPTRQWLWRRYERVFYPGDVRGMAIGQGLLLATPLQVANATATLARDGEYVSPLLIGDRRSEQIRRTIDLPPGAAALVRTGMYRVVNDPASQTAYRYATRQGTVMCGKTGTAQTGQPGRNMAWFTGFAPRDNPQIAFAFVLEYASSGGPDCVPLAEATVAECARRGYLNE